MKTLLFVIAIACALLLFLLASASANSSALEQYYPLLLGGNVCVTVLMFLLVAARLRRLRREYKRKAFGSRLKVRLLLMLALMAILPGMLVYGVSMQFAVKSIESWFDVRVDKALEGGLALGRTVLDTQQATLLAKAQNIGLELADSVYVSHIQMLQLRERADVDSLILFDSKGQALVSSVGHETDMLPPPPSSAQLRQARLGRGFAQTEGELKDGLLIRVLVPIFSLRGEVRVLQLTEPVPPNLARSAASVEEAHRDYQQLQFGKGGLKRIYTLTLTLTLLLALFSAIALAFFMTEKLAAPLLMLAEGTQAVAAGDYSQREAVESKDELGVLTRSFNLMTRQLDEARRETERHRAATEAARAYLESVLGNLSAGVIALDRHFVMRAANLGAVSILRNDLVSVEDVPLAEWPHHETFASAIITAFASNKADWQQQIDLTNDQGLHQTLLVRGTRMPDTSGGGYVVVFDDITDIISAQRSAAWGEVARRLAHEIKNPLTPIQLSAERLEMKLSDKLDDHSREMLIRSTQTIVNQVEALKNLVNEFRDYARTPPPVLSKVNLNALVRDVLGLYENAHAKVISDLEEELPDASADANQIRQVIHNLLTNAQDALADADSTSARIIIATHGDGEYTNLTVSDNGGGFPPQILAHAFEPYVTTKAKGTGLGLAIVKKIVDDHGGMIHLANREDGGAEVSIRLPVAA